MLSRALFSLTLLCCIQAERNVTADVRAFIAKFRELEEIEDVLEGFDRIGEYNMELYKLGAPLRSLIRTGVNLTVTITDSETRVRDYDYAVYDVAYGAKRVIEAHSEEGRAILELRSLFNRSHMIAYSYAYVFVAYNHMGPYKLQLALSTIETCLGELKSINHIKELRNSDYDPLRTLGFIDGFARLNCRMSDRKEIEKYAQVKEAIRRLVSRGFPQESSPIHGDSEIHFMPALLRTSDDLIHELVEDLDRIDIPTDEAVSRSQSFQKIIPQFIHSEGHQCILDMTNIEGSFNQTRLLTKIRSIYKDLLMIELSNWVLSTVIEPNEESYYEDGEIVALNLKRTGRFIAKWVRQFQNVSWPEIGIQAAKDAIGNETVQIDALNETARIVQKVFEEFGSQSYAYQVLVLPTSEVDVKWSVGTEGSGIYANITDFNGVDIHIFRYNRTESAQRAAPAKKWMKDKKEALLKAMSNNALVNTARSLSSMQTAASVGPIYGKDLYRSVIFLKKREAAVSQATTFPIGQATFENASYKLETYRTSYSRVISGLEIVHSFKAFLFL